MSTLQLGDNSEDKPSLLQASLASANDASTAASNLQPLIEWASDHKPAALKRPHYSESLPNVLAYHLFGTAPARAVRNSVKDGAVRFGFGRVPSVALLVCIQVCIHVHPTNWVNNCEDKAILKN